MRKFIGIILLLISLSGYSQTMSVESFKLLETDLDANTPGTSEKDQNGETAALIKVVTNQTGFTFDGGSLGIVKVKQTPGEVWVYIPRGAKKITIKHPQLGVLRDYYFSCPIEAARTYEMVLVTGSVQTIINQDAGGQYLVMNVDPPTSIVYIDDNEVTLQNGSLSKFLSYGNHTYRITDPLHATDAGSFEIGKEKKELDIKLQPSYGILQISTSPENGAKIFIDDDTESAGLTPFTTKKMKKGPHQFRFQLSGYDSKTITHEVHSDGSTQPLVVPLTSNFASVTIKVEDGCTVYINNEEKGVGNWKGRLAEGLYRIEARKPGHNPVRETINVVKGEDKVVSLAAPTPIYGGLNINSNPIGAIIYIDDEKVGKTPEIINKVLVGSHSVKFEKEGYTSEIKQITVSEGKIQELSVELKEKKQLVNSTNVQRSSIISNNNNSSPSVPAPQKSDANVVKQIMNSNSYNEANALVQNNLSKLNIEDRAKVYNKLVDLAFDVFNKQSSVVTENQLAKQMGRQEKPVDNELMTTSAYNAIVNAIECDKYDQQPNEKGKVAPKFAKKNAQRLWIAPRNQLVNAGQEAVQANDNAKGRKYWELFALSDAAPLFADCDRSPQKPFFGQVARFAAVFAYQDKDMDKALLLCDIAMQDPAEYEGCLNLKLEILGNDLKTKEDSVKYIGQLRDIYAKHNTDGVMEKLFNMLSATGDKAGAEKVLDDAIAANPNNYVALADKGLSMLDNNPAEAAKYLKKAAELKPDNAAIQTYAGTALSIVAQNTNDNAQKKAIYKEAIKYYDKAKELDPNRQTSKWGYNRYNAYYNYYGSDAPETKQAEADSK